MTTNPESNNMQALLNHVPHTFEPAMADKVAAQMQSNDDEWTYVVKHCPKGIGKSIIQIFDEDGEFVGLV
jgi:hypothetical protein